VLAVAIDGANVPPLQPGAERLWLPLPGGAGNRTVRVCWTSGDRKESLEAPSLECPRLDRVPDGPTVWTVHVPPGYEMDRSRMPRGADKATTTGAATLDLWRAAAQLQLLRRLQEHGRDANDRSSETQTAAIQDCLERLFRQAEYQLGQPGLALAPGPNGQAPAVWLQELRDEYQRLAPAERNRPKERAAASPVGQPFDLASFESGRPVYWQSTGNAAPPRVSLISLAAGGTRHTLALSTLLLVLLLAIWILARFFKAGSWPEQLIALGILGALLFGPVVGRLFLLLPLVGIAARPVQFVAWLRGKWMGRLQVSAER